MMQISRRDFVGKGAVIAALNPFLSVPTSSINQRLREVVGGDTSDPKSQEVCAAAISAAKEAGASYADVRLSHMYNRIIGAVVLGSEVMSAGVRVLVDGYWGFASSPIWSVDEGARLGRAAVRQAKANNIAGPREIDLVPLENVQSGKWIMPVKNDPFELNINEIHDYLDSLSVMMRRWPGVSPNAPSADFKRLDKFFASTLDQELFQRSYLTLANIGFLYMNGSGGADQVELDSLTAAGKGFEYIKEGNVREELKKLYEEVKEDTSLPFKPVEVGRYPMLLERSAVANLMHRTFGPATELDRILGYEANSTGTSFINDLPEMTGKLKIASPNITITSDRSSEGGAGTFRWDDEGVEPQNLTLIDKGVLNHLHTDRERAGWLNSNLSSKYPISRSSGNMVSDSAYTPANIFSGNLSIEPGDDSSTEQSMLEEMGDGIYIKRGSADMDFQLSSGVLTGRIYEVKNGKRTALLNGAGVLFKTLELWNGAAKVGGKSSQRTYGHSATKTNYNASTTTSVTASPVLFTEGTVFDVNRKA